MNYVHMIYSEDQYQAIAEGAETNVSLPATRENFVKLCSPIPPEEDDTDLTSYLKKTQITLVIGTKPNLTAGITKLIYHPEHGELELGFKQAKEAKPDGKP